MAEFLLLQMRAAGESARCLLGFDLERRVRWAEKIRTELGLSDDMPQRCKRASSWGLAQRTTFILESLAAAERTARGLCVQHVCNLRLYNEALFVAAGPDTGQAMCARGTLYRSGYATKNPREVEKCMVEHLLRTVAYHYLACLVSTHTTTALTRAILLQERVLIPSF